jgi:membrane protease YdiL (CAAX protease family)
MSDAPPPPRPWPPGRALDDAECTPASCGTCGLQWRVHRSLGGFRLRCECGAWIDVEGPPPVALPAPTGPAGLPTRLLPTGAPRDADGLVTLPGHLGETVYTDVPTHLPMAPGTVLRASDSVRRRWTNRTLFEFAALLAALIGPQLLAHLLSRGREEELLLPFASLLSGVLVLLVAANAGPYGLLGLRRASMLHYGEAILAAGVGLVCAAGWVQVLQAAFDVEPDAFGELRERLGPAASLFVIGVAPAVLEEITFRGVLQGRLQAMLGAGTGLVTTAAAFAVCHGQPAVLPIHVGLGLYLGWLRVRSGSLLPGMLLHFSYNAAVVLTGI